MATPSANHYMRQYTTAQLRAIVADPRHYGVGERLDADAILRADGPDVCPTCAYTYDRCKCPDPLDYT